MNAFERVMRTMSGEAVDRPPVLAVLGAYGGKLTGVPLPALYGNAELFVAGQKAVHETFRTDMVLGTFDFSLVAEAFGSVPRFFEHQPPNMKRPVATSLAEALEVPLPDPSATARLPMALASVRALADEFKGEVPVFAVLPGPAALPVLLLGIEGWMEGVLFEQSRAKALLERTGRFWVQWSNALFQAGADLLVVTEGMAAQEISTRELFASDLLPHVRHCFEQASGPLVFHHTGGRVMHILEIVKDLPNLAGIAVGSKDDLRLARKRVGPKLPLIGNLDNLSFITATEEALAEAARHCFDLNAECGPILTCNSGADIPIQTPPANIRAVVEASRTHRSRVSLGESTGTPMGLGCGVLEAEIETLRRRGLLDADVRYFNARLHLKPLQLEKVLDKATEEVKAPTLVVYGDCCPSMLQLTARPGVSRVERMNCCEMVLGKARYRELMRERAFLLLPEWTTFWKSIIEREFGMDADVAREFMNDHCSKLVYVDTGVRAVPREALEECSSFTGLPWAIEPAGLGMLYRTLEASLPGSSKG